MKKVLATGLLAICLLALSQQQASAWINSRFGIGFNWDWSCGGNHCCWGAWHNGQPPAPTFYGGYNGPNYPSHSMAPQPMFNVPAYALPAQPYAPQFSPPYQYAAQPRPVYSYQGR
jgi:hypothetical protein